MLNMYSYCVVLAAVLVFIVCNVISTLWKSLGYLEMAFACRRAFFLVGSLNFQLSDIFVMQRFIHCLAERCDLLALACRACSCLWISGWQGKSATCLNKRCSCIIIDRSITDVPVGKQTAVGLEVVVELK